MNFPKASSYKPTDPPDWRAKSIADYIREFSYLNGFKAAKFTINNMEVLV